MKLSDKKGRMTEHRTTNVQMSRTEGVVQASQPHFSHFTHCKIRPGVSAGSTLQLQEYTTKLSEKILRLRSIFCENASPPVCKMECLCEYVHKCKHMKAYQIRRGGKFGKKHGSNRSIRKQYLNYVKFFVRMIHRLCENRILLNFLSCPSTE